ncbi:hypothetical protein [Ilumatobacter sp.]|uniref:hypothetical protein n=1 Tax=Ilumatobacter sp. TaxID=1967498 RepID=UPI003B52155E
MDEPTDIPPLAADIGPPLAAPPPPAVAPSRPIPPPPGHHVARPGSRHEGPTATAAPGSRRHPADPARASTSDPEPAPGSTVTIRPWIDPVVDESGHDPRSLYVERFWLGVLGPTATWLVRRLVAGFETSPDGYDLDLAATARAMGLSYSPGRSSPFSKAVQRCTMFGLAHSTSDGLAIRRRIPTVAHRHLRRMPDAVVEAHESWQRTTITIDELSRAHRLAVAMLEVGDPATAIEHQLVALGVNDVAAAEAADNACRLEAP